MLNLFAAPGHINYAKCVWYLQQMFALSKLYHWKQVKFDQGFHAVCSDQSVIGQDYSRFLSLNKDLSEREWQTTYIISVFFSMSVSAIVHQAMTHIPDLTVKSSEQHVEMGMARS